MPTRLDAARLAHLQRVATQVRCDVVRMAHRGRTPHVGSALSVTDILVALYFHAMNWEASGPENDVCILSKGHSAMALYAVLAQRQIIPGDELDRYAVNGSLLAEHPLEGLPGVDWATGSLGHGLSLAVGHAHMQRFRQSRSHAYVIMSDGECQEGSVWEAAMVAAQLRLSNLTAIVDYNHQQAMGRTEDIAALEPLKGKFQAFGFETAEIDGHDFSALCRALGRTSGQPRAIIAHTTKGKGVSFMEDDTEWHYRPPSQRDLQLALNELQGNS